MTPIKARQTNLQRTITPPLVIPVQERLGNSMTSRILNNSANPTAFLWENMESGFAQHE